MDLHFYGGPRDGDYMEWTDEDYRELDRLKESNPPERFFWHTDRYPPHQIKSDEGVLQESLRSHIYELQTKVVGVAAKYVYKGLT